MLVKSYCGCIASASAIEPTPPASEQANCFPAIGSSSVVVSSISALVSAVNSAPPGRHILIAPGIYSGGTQTFDRQGTASEPIVIRPQNGIGTVTIDSPTWSLAAGSARLVLSGLHFNNSEIAIRGSHHRITRCQFRQIGRYQIRVFNAVDTRIDHCDFSDYQSATAVDKGAIQLDNASVGNNSLNWILIDYCYFHEIRQNVDVSASNIIYTGGGAQFNKNPNVVIDHCLVDDVGRLGSGEFFVIKVSGIIVRYCTFLNMAVSGYPSSYLQQRQGQGLEVRSCWFENMSSGALKMWDDSGISLGLKPLAIGNRFVGGHDLWIGAGNGNLTGQPFYHASIGGRYVGNHLESGRILVGAMWSDEPTVVNAQDNILEANIRASGGNAHQLVAATGTIINPTTVEPFTPAIKLNLGDVGLGAPDPLCQ